MFLRETAINRRPETGRGRWDGKRGFAELYHDLLRNLGWVVRIAYDNEASRGLISIPRFAA